MESSLSRSLAGKKALVTGGTHGIGLAVAGELASQGADVAILSRSQERLDHSSKHLNRFGVEILPIKADVLDPKGLVAAWGVVEKTWSGVDVLINNVGGGGRWGNSSILDTEEAVWGEVFQKNAGATIQLTKLALPFMLSRNWGRIVAITSIYAQISGGKPWFNVAKVAQRTVIQNLARTKEFVRNGVTFNSVAPGAIFIPDTGWAVMKSDNPSEFTAFEESLPLGRMGHPEEVAKVVGFICSPSAALLNGSTIVVDGGESCEFN